MWTYWVLRICHWRKYLQSDGSLGSHKLQHPIHKRGLLGPTHLRSSNKQTCLWSFFCQFLIYPLFLIRLAKGENIHAHTMKNFHNHHLFDFCRMLYTLPILDLPSKISSPKQIHLGNVSLDNFSSSEQSYIIEAVVITDRDQSSSSQDFDHYMGSFERL